MATIEQIKELVRCHFRGDTDTFRELVEQIIAQEDGKGRKRAAQELRSIMDHSSKQDTRSLSLLDKRVTELLSATRSDVSFKDLFLEDRTRRSIEKILLEYQHQDRIRSHGLEPVRKVLLIGPPGTGKTLTAAMMANEIGLPLFTIRLDAILSSYLGETSSKLKLVFDQMRKVRALYFFDEFDAIGSERTDRNEVGEMRRILNSFLLFIEDDDSDSIIMCATNHPHLLDRALFRRFDTTVEYHLPSKETIIRLIRSKLADFDVSTLDCESLVEAAMSLSHSEIIKACNQVIKDTVIRGDEHITTEALCNALRERRTTQNCL